MQPLHPQRACQHGVCRHVSGILFDCISHVFERERKLDRPDVGAEQRDLVEIGQRERSIRPREPRIELDRALLEAAGLHIFRGVDTCEMPHSAVVALPGVQAFRRLARLAGFSREDSDGRAAFSSGSPCRPSSNSGHPQASIRVRDHSASSLFEPCPDCPLDEEGLAACSRQTV
jgi:hypothetical protein